MIDRYDHLQTFSTIQRGQYNEILGSNFMSNAYFLKGSLHSQMLSHEVPFGHFSQVYFGVVFSHRLASSFTTRENLVFQLLTPSVGRPDSLQFFATPKKS
jgi:hypothetical protein